MVEILKINKIKKGTVIDHIPAGKVFEVMRILKLENSKDVIMIGVNVYSDKLDKKDILKVENRFLNKDEIMKISIVAPDATINYVKDYKIFRKFNLELPSVIEGVIVCSNRRCVSNSKEPIISRFRIIVKADKKVFRCEYCGRELSEIVLK